MLRNLFRGLTAQPAHGARMFDAITRKTRRKTWYVEGEVPDSLDGRFAVLATVTALVIVRLEQEGSAGNQASVALTERFIEVMESEHRELGLGDPTLGRTVRKLVSLLARRTEIWRSSVGGDWAAATKESLYKEEVDPVALRHSAEALKTLWERLREKTLDEVEQGTFA